MGTGAATPLADKWTEHPDYNSFIHFLRHRVQPPSVYYVVRDDVLELLVFSPTAASTVNLTLRFMEPNGEVQPRFEQFIGQTSGTTPHVIQMPNAEGFLISATVETPGAPRGQCFVVLRVRRGLGTSDLTLGDVLLQGYPGSVGVVAYPQSPLASALDGRGRMRSITLANPVAGADFTTTVPAGVNWILRGLTATLTTAIAVAVRQASLELTDAVPNVLLRSAGSVTQAASLAFVYSWFNGGFPNLAGPNVNGGLPEEFRLLAGWKISSVTAAIQAADQWSSIALAVEEFVAG